MLPRTPSRVIKASVHTVWVAGVFLYIFFHGRYDEDSSAAWKQYLKSARRAPPRHEPNAHSNVNRLNAAARNAREAHPARQAHLEAPEGCALSGVQSRTAREQRHVPASGARDSRVGRRDVKQAAAARDRGWRSLADLPMLCCTGHVVVSVT